MSRCAPTNITKSWLKLQLIIWKILYHNPSRDPWNWLRRVGASSWLTSLPIEEFGFTLHKGAFRDAIAFRYEWPSPRIPVSCDCGSWNLLYRAQKVDFHHFAITRSGTWLLTCYQKFAMTSVSNPAYNHFQERHWMVRPPMFKMVHTWILWLMDFGGLVWENLFWCSCLYPLAPSHCQYSLSTYYRKQENLNKRAYEQRVIGRLNTRHSLH